MTVYSQSIGGPSTDWQVQQVQEDGASDEVLRTIKIKGHSKLDALEKLRKSLHLWTDKVEVSGGLDIPTQLTAVRRRARRGKEESNRSKA